MAENMRKRKWLRPLEAVARSIVFAWLVWLWWIGVRSFYPDDEGVRDVWNRSNQWIYLGLTIIFGLSGVALTVLLRS
jgi:hypothetical protein